MSIHGRLALPHTVDRGYAMVLLPPNAEVGSEIPAMSNSPASHVTISCSYSLAKAFISLLQSAFAITTLVRASEGEQISLYGYSAFSLTDAPYAVMSLINLFANLLCPQYSSLYMVRNDVMDEAEARYGKSFEGVVGRVLAFTEEAQKRVEEAAQPVRLSRLGHWIAKTRGRTDEEWVADAKEWLENPPNGFSRFLIWIGKLYPTPPKPDDIEQIKITAENCKQWTPRPNNEYDLTSESVMAVPACEDFLVEGNIDRFSKDRKSLLKIGVLILLLGTPFIIIGSISRFAQGSESTTAQRIWIMLWICWGQFWVILGVYVPFMDGSSATLLNESPHLMLLSGLGFVLILSAPAFGGFVVVGQMLKAHGNCVRLY